MKSKKLKHETLYPNKRFILTSLLLGKSVKEVLDVCKLYEVDIPDSVTLDLYKQFLKENIPIFDKNNPDFDLLFTHNLYHLTIYYLLEEDEDYAIPVPVKPIGVEGAFRIVEDPHMRRLITALALCDIQEEDMDLIVNARYNYDYAPEDVRMFVNYFADFHNFKFSDRKSYVDGIQDNNQKRTYRYALDNDKNMVLWKLGLAPDKSFDTMLRDIATDCFYNYKETAAHDANEAQKWAQLLLKTQERLEKIDAEDGDKKDLFGSITFQIQAAKANTAIANPEKVQIELPTTRVGSNVRRDIVSIEQLEKFTNDTTTPKEKDNENSQSN